MKRAAEYASAALGMAALVTLYYLANLGGYVLGVF